MLIVFAFVLIDINECSAANHRCSNISTCFNTLGSYNCECHEGYEPVESIAESTDLTTCRGKIFWNYFLVLSIFFCKKYFSTPLIVFMFIK